MEQDKTRHAVHYGAQCPPSSDWAPFRWEEPGHGEQVFGEFTLARSFGTTGNLRAGFWRVAPTSQGNPFADSSKAKMVYSAPSGDEIACVVDGTATLTVVSTGQRYNIGPGSIVSCPKGLTVEWEFEPPFFKKYWCSWNASSLSPAPPTEVKLNHVNDNPEKWTPYRRIDPEQGELISGELYSIWNNGSTGSLKCGVWRSGRGVPSTNGDADGKMVNPYTGATGDETMLLLEGEVDIIETESGKHHLFRAGDAFGLSAGMHVTWISRAPFVRKLWMITRDEQPN